MTVAERIAAMEAAKAEAAKVRAGTTHTKKGDLKQPKRRAHRKQSKTSGDDDNDDGPAVPLAVFTIPMFCRAHDLSQAFYFKLKKLGLGPREMHIGTGKKGRVLITLEAAAEWRREREAAAQSA